MKYTELEKALHHYVTATNRENAAIRLGQTGEAEKAREQMAKALQRIRQCIIAESEDPM